MGFAELFATLSPWSILLFVVGIGLFIAELFLPGFGLIGGLGVLCLMVDVVITARSFAQGMMLAGGISLLLFVLFLCGLRLASKGRLPRRLVLQDKTDFSSTQDLRALIGHVGLAATILRPAGCVDIEGRRYDVVSYGEFIEPGAQVVVLGVEGNRVVVASLEGLAREKRAAFWKGGAEEDSVMALRFF